MIFQPFCSSRIGLRTTSWTYPTTNVEQTPSQPPYSSKMSYEMTFCSSVSTLVHCGTPGSSSPGLIHAH
eukprot:12541971-Heterocapsa_arctica.AAC.1